MSKGFRFLFVCTGNTCRSPMANAIAERMLKHIGWGNAETISAGVSVLTGVPASEGAILASAEQGLDIQGHLSRPLSEELVDWADFILAMDLYHLEVVEMYGGHRKSALLSSFSDNYENGYDLEILDPFAGNIEVYQETFCILEDLVESAMVKLYSLSKDSNDIGDLGEIGHTIAGNDE
jgi:protein-tyrosine-phosphatase